MPWNRWSDISINGNPQTRPNPVLNSSGSPKAKIDKREHGIEMVFGLERESLGRERQTIWLGENRPVVALLRWNPTCRRLTQPQRTGRETHTKPSRPSCHLFYNASQGQTETAPLLETDVFRLWELKGGWSGTWGGPAKVKDALWRNQRGVKWVKRSQQYLTNNQKPEMVPWVSILHRYSKTDTTETPDFRYWKL